MPTVFIPTLLQALTGGQAQVDVAGSTVRQVIENLDQAHPGLKSRLVENDRLRSNISVAIDGEICSLGLLERIEPDSEVHFVHAISGG